MWMICISHIIYYMFQDQFNMQGMMQGVISILFSLAHHISSSLLLSVQFSCSVVSNSLWPPGTAAHQVSLSITNSQNFLRLMSIKLMMRSNHLILCHPLLLLPSIFPSIRVFFKESVILSHQMAKVLELQFQRQSFQWKFRNDFH